MDQRSDMSIGLHVIRSRARQTVPWVLALWVAFLLANFLQPCCEAIAAALPHSHGVQAPSHCDEATWKAMHQCAPEEHSHCGQAHDFNAELPPTAVSTIEFRTPSSPIAVDAGLFVPGDGLAHIQLLNPAPSRAPPRLYLKTLRLRI